MATPVTILGLGPMGRALAGAYIDAGHPVTVWNRTAAKADDLVERGATLAASPADAVAASPLVIVSVLDYAAARAIMEPAADALKGRALVNLTADTPENARATAVWAVERGIDYLDGAIMTPTFTIGGPHAVVIYSGPEDVHAAHRSDLAILGGSQTFLGTEPGLAAAHDVALLDIWWNSVTALAHGFALAAAEDVRGADFAPFAQGIAALLPEVITAFGVAVDTGEYGGEESNLVSTAAALDHIVDASDARGLDTGLPRASRDAVRRAIAAGHGGDGLFRLVSTLRTR